MSTVTSTITPSAAVYRSIDGTGNNLSNPEWGSTGEQLLRESPAAYADGVSTPAGTDRPSARAVSDAVAAAEAEGLINDRNLTAFTYVWGQFLDHDLDLTGAGSTAEAFNVLVPVGDPSFDPLSTGTAVIPLTRSQFDPGTGTSAANPRQQTNSLTAWIDGSVVYGSDPARAAALRTFVGGRLKTSDGSLLPFNTAGLPNANDAHLFPDDQLFVAGDVRANENIELTSIQTLFLREHNRIAASLAARNPRLSDEQLYQQARQLVAAEIQAITYNEFLPALLGRGALDRYTGYDPTVNPNIANEFSTAAFRLGHSMLGDDVEFLDNNGNELFPAKDLSEVFFNPAVVEQTGIEPILKYLASDRMQEVDTKVVDAVRNFLFGPPGAGGLDLASLNIQRGRDHGLGDYNSVRAAYGLPRVTSFAEITSDPQLQASLQSLYGSVNNIDLWVGGLAEDHVAGSTVGPLFRTILSDQFERLRDGDRFWYQNGLQGGLTSRQRSDLDHLQLSDIVRRNSGTTNLQDDVFVLNVTVLGSLFDDANANGRRDFRERALAGWTVQLLDADGNVVASAVSTASGRYKFSGLDLGTYEVNVVTPAGWSQTTRDLKPVQITRGINVSGLDYGYKRVTV
jgi:peroxidase